MVNVFVISAVWIVAGVLLSVLFGYFCSTGRGSSPYFLARNTLSHYKLPSWGLKEAQPAKTPVRGLSEDSSYAEPEFGVK